ncbi:hypothetical protein [Streptomyces sp. NPDC001978]|uniref:hypothetical protein n=1 Tax=Streptomyces sp. NPDC001978 TaxID=3364627 RepID=UPI0036A94211
MTLIALAVACPFSVTLGYVGMCAASPFGTCRKCNGFGFGMETDRKGRPKRGKSCRRCKATGKRIRVGRWLFNRAQRIYREGTH